MNGLGTIRSAVNNMLAGHSFRCKIKGRITEISKRLNQTIPFCCYLISLLTMASGFRNSLNNMGEKQTSIFLFVSFIDISCFDKHGVRSRE